MPRPPAGQIQTVLGAIAQDAMGITLPHEHLLIDFKVMFAEPAAAADKARAAEPVSLANLGWVRQNFNANLDNLRLQDEQVAQDEILLFKQAGGRTWSVISTNCRPRSSRSCCASCWRWNSRIAIKTAKNQS